YRHSKAPVTTFVVKDRVLGHNPVAVLYSEYLRNSLKRKPEERLK
ncbi:MAG: metal-binding protein, partial [Synergistaceae bacterium]|nr:metal-binding protein [Synergistaceae bacterium]